MDVRPSKGFTLVELLVVIVVIAILAVQLLQVSAMTGKNARRLQCVSNIKEIGLAFSVWGGEHDDKYPTAVRTANGGAEENIVNRDYATLVLAGASMIYQVTNVFSVMSNELRTPKVLYCPADLSTNKSGATNWGSFGGGNLSYFVDGDAAGNYPKMILIGDRNIGNVIGGVVGAPALPYWGILPADSMFIQNHAYGSAAALGASVKVLPWAWTDSDLHQDSGNLGMADGSANQTSLSGLIKPINDTINAPGFNKIILNMP